MSNRKYYISQEQLENLYLSKELSEAKVATILGCSQSTAHSKLIEYEISRRTKSEIMKKRWLDKENSLRIKTQHYCKEPDCNKEIGYNTWKYGKGRCNSCSQKERYRYCEHPRKGKHPSEETRKKMRESHPDTSGKNNATYIDGRSLNQYYCIECGRKIVWKTWWYGRKRCNFCANGGKNNAMFGKLPRPKWEDYKGIKMRSSWERYYAFYLDNLKVKWEYEPKRFDLGNTTYFPDFYLPQTDEYIEIKGWWHTIAEEKFKLFKQKYPNIKIIVLMKPELQKLGVL